jgi:nitronate monooxygenase
MALVTPTLHTPLCDLLGLPGGRFCWPAWAAWPVIAWPAPWAHAGGFGVLGMVREPPPIAYAPKWKRCGPPVLNTSPSI